MKNKIAFKKLVAIPLIASVVALNSFNISAQSNFINEEKQEDFLFKEENQIKIAKTEIFNITKKTMNFIESIDFYNELDDHIKILFFEKATVVLNLSTFTISETILDRIDKNDNFSWLPIIGIIEKNGYKKYQINTKEEIFDTDIQKLKETYKQNKNKINIDENKKELKKLLDQKIRVRKSADPSSIGEHFDGDLNSYFDHIVEQYEWFRHKTTDYQIGYVTDGRIGLCEYIALAMMIEYQELFCSSGFFTDSEWDSYYTTPINNSNNFWYGSPIHKNYLYSNPTSSVAYRLYELSGKSADVKTAKTLNDALIKFLNQNGKNFASKVRSDWSATLIHSSHPEDYLIEKKVPVMISFANIFKLQGHNVVIYGWNSKTRKYLTHYGWPNGRNSERIINKSDVWGWISPSYWYSFKVKDQFKKETRKAFNFKNEVISYDQFKAKYQ
ncbi:putative cysteine peptidase [Mycoplasmopsis gallinacea]|uniref:Peptidase C39-like domain-containing protein n=1 Tax=Mycoplasmopsis gallinacea TaxID=29556 RepID=A0A6H0V4V7_9BACT|nr:hypothetical protein [Mycoplasmopsis gallinacea]QIW62506.1 hypothetical protein GOQ20_03745 [Mycoplasmopsis gallinacea]